MVDKITAPLPVRGDDDWWAERDLLDTQMKNAINALIDSQTVAVRVVSGNEARPLVDLAIWVDERSGISDVNRPVAMRNGDIWVRKATNTPSVPLAPVITTTSLALVRGTAVAVTLQTSGGVPTSWSRVAGTLPAGLTLSGNTITGTPTTEQSYSFTIRASNAVGSDDQVFSGTVAAPAPAGTPPQIDTTSLPAMTQGTPVSISLAASGSTPRTWGISAGALPSGLGISSSTGSISGTPSGSGPYDFTVSVTNGSGTATRRYTGTIVAVVLTRYHVFGNPPVPAPSLYDDGNGSLRLATAFYGTRTWKLVGARLWLPSLPVNSGDLRLFSVNGFAPNGQVFTPTMSDLGSLPAGQQALIPASALKVGWNEVIFGDGLTIAPWTNVPATGTFAWLAYFFANGRHYLHNPMAGALQGAVESVEVSGVSLVPSDFGAPSAARGWNTFTPERTTAWYGIDPIFELV